MNISKEEKQAMFDQILMGPNGDRRIVHIGVHAYRQHYFNGKHDFSELLKKWPDKKHLIAEVEAKYKQP
jgi:hypothetical protein